MPRTVSKEVYQFEELSDEAKETARQWWREGDLYDGWYESVYEDAKEMGRLMGITIDKIYFSGFSSQGDGACFEGHYDWVKGGVKAIKDATHEDTVLHRIAHDLQLVQRPTFYNLSASVKQRGHYMHEGCTEINISDARYSWFVSDEAKDGLAEVLRDFMNWIYRRLEKEYDYQMSDECVDEAIIANEYDFNEDGSRA